MTEVQEIDNGFQLYDSELDKLIDLMKEIEGRVLRRQRVDRDALGNEIRERCANEVGLKVSVRWYTCGEEMPDGTVREIPGMYQPEVVPIDRVTKESEYDHDRQRHEVVNDVIGIGEGGIIKVTAADVRAALEHGKGHKH